MPTYRSFPKSRTKTSAAAPLTVQRARFRHRFGRADVIDVIDHCAPHEGDPAVPPQLDRAAHRASLVARAGYDNGRAATSLPRLPGWSIGA